MDRMIPAGLDGKGKRWRQKSGMNTITSEKDIDEN